MNEAPLLISLSSFGAAEVRRHGQLWFTRLAAEAGADGVEVRGELLTNAAAELDALADATLQLGLTTVYSSPEGLFAADGTLDDAALDRALAAAARLQAPRLKMSIGGYGAASRSASAEALPALRLRLQQAEGIELVIENDQTPTAGTVRALVPFFEAAADAALPLPMVFDMGNWHWLGECPLQAAQALASRVGYVHCKGVQRLPAKWVAVPLADSAAPWRTLIDAMPRGVPWAIEYPLIGDDLLAVTRTQVDLLRALSRSL
ncbi:sugar phosphate isomerase/epimerase [Aquincola sp. J276]|uniref:sugar phosphate isomerase/epimerase family protein n=1 Tax=Aquincola sp. J276 TaxID=2898432 RepID=UPI002150DC58|nr:TIM barrel protein [Aquincola sp. J276]MCR5868712.1 TIM barrel protein [Aquincola sp. J276]